MREVTSDPEPDFDDLIGLDEIAVMLGVGREAAVPYTKRPDFPAPEKCGRSPLWWRPDVADWIGLPPDADEEDLADAGPDFPEDALPFALDLSREAAERIRARGGRLFLWSEPVGMGERDHVSFSPPPDLLFESRLVHFRSSPRLWGGEEQDVEVEVFVPEDFPFAELTIGTERWPLRGLRIYVDGLRWGWRGSPWSVT